MALQRITLDLMLLWPLACLALTGLVLAYAAFFYGGVVPENWNVCLLAIGCITALYWIFSRKRDRAPRLEPLLLWPIILLPCYLAFELIPLPLSVLKTLSPARAELLQALQPLFADAHSAPLSVMPPAALAQLFRIIAYIAVFLLIRELTWRFLRMRWAIAVPLLIVGTLEAALGMIQCAADWGNATAHGTYVERDHFAGLLEMLLPFALMYGMAILRRGNARYSSPAWPAALACLLFAIAALFLVGIIYSLSRMGFLVALSSLFAMAALTVGPALASARLRWLSLGVIALLVILIFVFLPPDQLITRFAELASTDKVSGDTRLHFWRETLPLIAAYPLFGCGLGGFESAFRRFQTTETLFSVDFTHNDYLQFLAELGVIGFTMLAVFLGGIVWKTVGAAWKEQDVDGRYLAIACAGSLIAILLHSMVDFNLQIPANAMVFSWVCGLSVGLYFKARPVRS